MLFKKMFIAEFEYSRYYYKEIPEGRDINLHCYVLFSIIMNFTPLTEGKDDFLSLVS